MYSKGTNYVNNGPRQHGNVAVCQMWQHGISKFACN